MNVTMPLWEPVSAWFPPSEFPDLRNARLIAVDLETKDRNLKTKGPGGVRNDGYPVGIAVAAEFENEPPFKGYFPFAHAFGGNMDKDMVCQWAREQMKSNFCPKIFANALYDLEWGRVLGIEFNGPIYDIQIAEALLDEEKETGYSLDVIAKERLGFGKDESLLREAAATYGLTDVKSDLWMLPARFVGNYAEGDVLATIEVFKIQKLLLEKEELWDIFIMESELLPLLLEMRFKGVRVDIERAHEVARGFKVREKQLHEDLCRYAGFDMSPNSAQDIQRVCSLKGLHYGYTESGNPSFTKKWLQGQEAPFFTKITEWRAVNKLRETFIEQAIISSVHNGRLYAQFHSMRKDDSGTRTGRFSSSTPNLQQVPKRNQDAWQIRSIFIPDEGFTWAKFDYSQQEPRIMVHYGVKRRFRGAEEARARYVEDPNTDFYRIIVDFAKVTRDEAKIVYLARCYGQGLASMAADLRKSEEEAKKIAERIDEYVPFIRDLSREVSRFASERGWIKTLLGRKRHFNHWEPVNWDVDKGGRGYPRRIEIAQKIWQDQAIKRAHVHKALNSLIQGGAADMTKAAMLKLWKEYKIVPHMQVHDELNCSVSCMDDALLIKAVMENCIDLNVPILSELKMGPNWGQTK